MSNQLILIVGLGNYPKEYQYTRHNIGFLVLDALHDGRFMYKNHNGADISDFERWVENSKAKGNISFGTFFGRECLLLKPNTYMNLSGESVVSVVNFYKIKPENIIVIHDEMEIAFGHIRYSTSRNSAGHNGIKSINNYIKYNYNRIRVGIGRPHIDGQDVGQYVISKFTREELSEMDNIYTNSILTLKTLLMRYKLYL